jgi:hypothetical protein
MGVIKEQELIDAIDELKHGRHTIQTCEKLAAVITCLQYMYPEEEKPTYAIGSYSGAGYGNEIGLYGDTEFLRAIAGKNSETTWKLIDEAMSILAMTNKRLYEHIMNRI